MRLQIGNLELFFEIGEPDNIDIGEELLILSKGNKKTCIHFLPCQEPTGQRTSDLAQKTLFQQETEESCPFCGPEQETPPTDLKSHVVDCPRGQLRKEVGESLSRMAKHIHKGQEMTKDSQDPNQQKPPS